MSNTNSMQGFTSLEIKLKAALVKINHSDTDFMKITGRQAKEIIGLIFSAKSDMDKAIILQQKMNADLRNLKGEISNGIYSELAPAAATSKPV